MSESRLKGQDISILFVANGRTLAGITAIKSFSFTEEFEKIARDYLNERTSRFDEIYKGIAGKVEFDIESRDVFNVINQIKDRAKRRTQGVKINIKATLTFPNGDRVIVAFRDVSVGSIPIEVGGRTEYAHSSFDFSVGDCVYIA